MGKTPLFIIPDELNNYTKKLLADLERKLKQHQVTIKKEKFWIVIEYVNRNKPRNKGSIQLWPHVFVTDDNQEVPFVEANQHLFREID